MSEEFNKEEIIKSIKQLFDEAPIILFMKGSPEAPQCGFSATAIQVLQACSQPFAYINILQYPDIRATLKEVTNWPTFPQLIVNGELVGGSDILTEMYEEGELEPLLVKAAASAKTDTNSASADDDGYESDTGRD